MFKAAPISVEIDDSGYGSLYGGIIILVTDGVNDFYKEVPIKLFAIQSKSKRTESINKEIFNIIKKGLRHLGAKPKKTTISICQGNTFDFAEAKTKALGYSVTRKKIIGRTNLKAERYFKQLLSEKYNIKNYSPKDYKKENLRQYEMLRQRRDFKNVKRNSRGVQDIENRQP